MVRERKNTGHNMTRDEAANAYRNLRTRYQQVYQTVYGEEVANQTFRVDCTRYLVDIGAVPEDVCTPRAAPATWVDAAEAILASLLDSYIVRNTLDPTCDVQWEAMEIAAGRW